MFYPKLNFLLNTTSKIARLLEAKFMYSQNPTQVQHMVFLLGKKLLLPETRPKVRTQIYALMLCVVLRRIRHVLPSFQRNMLPLSSEELLSLIILGCHNPLCQSLNLDHTSLKATNLIPQARNPSISGCPRMLIQYIQNYPTYL
jgi:hypothetical protein